MKAKNLANILLQIAKQNEPIITKDIGQIALVCEAQIVGLEHKFKSEESLMRKLTDYSTSKKLPIEVVAKLNNDTLRYTFLLSQDGHFVAFEQIKDEFITLNYRIGKIYNAWEFEGTSDDRGYRGINITIISSQKLKFELQLHTKESFDLKT